MSLASNVAQRARVLAKQPVQRAAHALAEVSSDGAKLATKLQNVGDVLLRSGNDPRFAALQRRSHGAFTRVINEDWGSKMGRKADELWFGGHVEYVPSELTGKAPHQVKGAVFHEQPLDKLAVAGDVNLNSGSNTLFNQFDNKLKEAQFIQQYAPGAIAKTESMADVIKELGLQRPGPRSSAAERKEFLDALQTKLHERYPQGFFVKGLRDCNTGGNMATDKSNLAELHAGYLKDYAPQKAALLAADPDVDLSKHLRDHPFAAGRTVDELLRDPRRVAVQERLKLARWTTEELPRDVQPFQEYRLHVVDGHVVPGATSHRWSVSETFKSANELSDVEAWTEAQFQKFPEHVQQTQGFAPDVAKLEDGSYRFIELNVGGLSGILYKNPLAAAAVSEAITGHAAPIRHLSNPIGKASQKVGDKLNASFQAIGKRLQKLAQ